MANAALRCLRLLGLLLAWGSTCTHAGAPKGLRRIKLSEVQKHTSRDKGMWIIIDGYVFDVTKFAHPGGRVAMKRNAGKDATQGFHAQLSHRSSTSVPKLMRKLVIGQLDNSSDDDNREPSQPPDVDDNRAREDLYDDLDEEPDPRRAAPPAPEEAWEWKDDL